MSVAMPMSLAVELVDALMSEPSCEWRCNRSSSRRKHLPGERAAVIPWRCNGIAKCRRTALAKDEIFAKVLS
jgi:hypothetical protein